MENAFITPQKEKLELEIQLLEKKRDDLQNELYSFDFSPLITEVEEGSLAKFVPYVSAVLSLITLIVVFVKK